LQNQNSGEFCYQTHFRGAKGDYPSAGEIAVASWLDDVIDTLDRDRWNIKEDVRFNGWIIPFVAHYSGFAPSRFGNYERFFVFTEFDEADRRDVMDFSRTAFTYSMAKKTSFLPCGFFEAVTCYSVSIVEDIDDRSVRSIESTTPPQHWGAFEYPIVYDKHHDELIYFKGTAMWGALYYSDMRGDIKRYLAPR